MQQSWVPAGTGRAAGAETEVDGEGLSPGPAVSAPLRALHGPPGMSPMRLMLA